MRASHVEALKDFFRRNFPFGARDHELIQRLIEETYRNRRGIDVAGLCGYYAAVAPFEGRVLLLRLLFQVARADPAGLTGREEELIRQISANLGLGEQVFRQVRAEIRGDSGRAWEILGVPPGSDIEDIKAAYRQLSMENHPDKVASLGPEFVKVAEERFKAIQEAYEEVRRERGF